MKKMVCVSDYIVEFLAEKEVKDVFLLAGGGIMYLLDAVGRSKKINYIANHHEQACAIAAEAYARVTNKIGVCFVTTGPGSTNAITGVAGAWVDSIPILVISGQVKRELIADYKKVRQVGPQEINIIDMVKGITKYAKTIMDPNTIRYELEKAFYEAKNGRPGPVWLNIPLDVQGTMVDKNNLKSFKPVDKEKNIVDLDKKIFKVKEMIIKSKRPVIIAGNGVRLSGGLNELRKIINKLKIPVILPINGLDLFEEKYKYLAGKFGPVGQRRGNFVLQNSDLIISIGASLNVASTGFDYDNFGRKAKKVLINIDLGEMKARKFKMDLTIKCDAKVFINGLLKSFKNEKINVKREWLSACSFWKNKYKNITSDYFEDTKHVNSYIFFDYLSDFLNKSNFIVTGIALDAVGLFQAFKVKKGQRAFVNKNFGQMGWDLPAVIGTCLANNKRKTILVAGDGSIQLNIQELQTIKYCNLPIKIFIFNNTGYESIRATQSNLFNGNFVGACPHTGVSNPDFRLLAKTHGFKYQIIKNNKQLKSKLKKVLSTNCFEICEVNISFNQKRTPKVSSYREQDGTIVSKPLEDMFPFLDEKEIWENMHMFDEDKI